MNWYAFYERNKSIDPTICIVYFYLWIIREGLINEKLILYFDSTKINNTNSVFARSIIMDG